MRRASVLLVALLALALLSNCCPRECVKPVVEQPPPPPEQPPPPPPPPPPKEEKVEVKEIILQPIYFDFDKYNLRPGDREILNKNAQVLKENPTVKMRIEGNCDERGTVEYNLALGEKRARAAKDYLVKMGIDPDKITIISYGKEKSMRCRDDACWSKDRRDDFMIISR